MSSNVDYVACYLIIVDTNVMCGRHLDLHDVAVNFLNFLA